MTQRGAVILAAALTAFVLVVAGGVAGRLSQRAQPAPASAAPSAPVAAPRTVVAARAVERRAVAPRPAVWREHEHEHARGHEEHEDDDD